jgi:hypothetical protein
MLNITGLNRFFFVRDFHDMRCKYDKVLSIIHQQLNREPEDDDVFIVMSKGLRLVLKVKPFKIFTAIHNSINLVGSEDRTFN